MFCKKCGIKIPSEAAFCPRCGQPVQTDADEISTTEAAGCSNNIKPIAEEQSANFEKTNANGSAAAKFRNPLRFKNLIECLWAVVILDVISTVSDWADTSVVENAFNCIFTFLFIWLTLAVTWRKSWAKKLYVCYTAFILLSFSFALVGNVYAYDDVVDAINAVLRDIGGLTIISLAIQLYCAFQLLFNQKIKLLFESDRKATGAQANANRLSCILWLLVVAVTWIGYSFYLWSQVQNAIAEGIAEGIAEAETTEATDDDDEEANEEYIKNLFANIDDELDSTGEKRSNHVRSLSKEDKAKAVRIVKTGMAGLFKAGVENSGKIAKLLKCLVLGVIGLIVFVFNKLRGK